STLSSIMPSKFSWSWPTFSVLPPQTGWRHGWRDAWREAWNETWSSPDIQIDGLSAASVGSLADPNSAIDLNALSQLSVIALVGLAFEARIAAGPGGLVAVAGPPSGPPPPRPVWGGHAPPLALRARG